MVMFQWFVRAHLENSRGSLGNEGATTESEAAASVETEAAAPARSR